MAQTVYTIGHSNHTLDEFVALLRDHSVTRVVDVRSVPYSRYSPQFQKQPLSAALDARDFDYQFLGESLGGKIDCDYASRARQDDFIAGIDQLIKLAKAEPTTILCAEKDPRSCHRRLLVTPALIERGVLVAHILADGSVVHDQDLDPVVAQLSLF